MDSEKLVKIVVKGRVTENGVLDADHRETIAVYVDPFDKTLRTFVLKTAYQRFPWLEKVPENQMRMYWIDAESDQISIYVEDDMETCIAIGGNVPKIYIDLNTNPAKPTPSVGFMTGPFLAGPGCPFSKRFGEASAGQSSANAAQSAASSGEPATGGPTTTSSQSQGTANALHVNVICDGCEGEVRGFRYKCVQCRDFDLCHACETKGIHRQHVMYRMPEPLSEQGIRFDRRMMKSLRKRLPREDSAPSCRRARHHDHSESSHHHNNPSHANANVTDHVADAIRHARNSEKIASVGIDMISNFAQHFASLMDPFGVTMDAVTGTWSQPQPATTSTSATAGTSTTTGTSATTGPSATTGTSATTGPSATTGTSAAAYTSTPKSTQAAVSTPTTTTTRSSTPTMTPSTSHTISAGTGGNATRLMVDDDIDDFEDVPYSIESHNALHDSVVEALIEATKDVSVDGNKRQNMDFD